MAQIRGGIAHQRGGSAARSVESLMSDPTEHIRIPALDALQGSANLREFAAVALTDSSPHIPRRAQEFLKEIEADDRLESPRQ